MNIHESSNHRIIESSSHNGFGSICAVIIAYNPGRGFAANFTAIKGQVDKVIIIDNASGDETRQVLKNLEKENKDGLEIIYNNENFGVAKAQNIGIKMALKEGYDWVMLLDHDSTAMPKMVLEMMNAYFANPLKNRIGIIAPYIEEQNVQKNQYGIISFLGALFKRVPLKGVKYINDILSVTASGSLIKRTLLEEIGLMYEEFFIDCIDMEYCLRAITRKWKIMVAGQAVLKHRIGNKTAHDFFGFKFATSNHDAARRYSVSRNRLIFWRLYWNKVPALVYYSFLAALFEIFLILSFEGNKLEKLKNIILGSKDGLVKKIEK